MSRTTVLLADDHKIVAEGLASLLKQAFDLVGTVHDGQALLEAARTLKPDVIVTDISMPLLNGIDVVRQLRAEGIPSRVIVLTMHTEADVAVDAFRAGVSGYVVKQSAGEELMTAIEEVRLGRAYLSPLITKDLITVLLEARDRPGQEGPKLTPRQRQVLQLIAEGHTAKEIASLLNISARTAESHKYEMMQALGVETTAELIQYAIRLHLIPVKGGGTGPKDTTAS
ncbi:MAG: response regulator transcription factor [Acidobacteria bacterium]|nr:response regulator transcription factor [Acidobacteriota bacterium]MBI3278463.1 response regulator transcription factor [Acidobacteriota bacterium]